MANKSEMADSKVGYTDDMFILTNDLRIHTRFVATLIRFELMSIRHGQVINSNFGYKQFEKLRDESND